MPSEQVDLFHGDKEVENPEDFLRVFFRRMGTASDDVKKQQFKYFLQVDSMADEWYEDLKQAKRRIGMPSRSRSMSGGQGRKWQRRQQKNTKKK